MTDRMNALVAYAYNSKRNKCKSHIEEHYDCQERVMWGASDGRCEAGHINHQHNFSLPLPQFLREKKEYCMPPFIKALSEERVAELIVAYNNSSEEERYPPPKPMPEDEVVGGVKLHFCTWCCNLRGRLQEGRTSSKLLERCTEFGGNCEAWVKKGANGND